MFIVREADIPHVMISYNHGAQSLMIKLKNTLKTAGYKVWMDIDNMSKLMIFNWPLVTVS